jgi:hypothetical protein
MIGAVVMLSAACGSHPASPPVGLPLLPKATLAAAPTEVRPAPTASPAPSPTGEPTASVAPCPIVESGGLISELDRIAALQPGPDTQGMAIPTDAQLSAWEQVFQALSRSDTRAACDLLQDHTLPYQVVQFTDLPFQDDQVLLLREIEPLTVGWGTYAYRPQAARDLVIEAPHPLEDSYTRGEGITFFRQLEAKALLVAGAHRCANAEFSSCGGTTIACGQVEAYRTSDVAHAVRTPFQVAHRTWAPCGSETIVVQLHGNGLETCPDLFLSNGTLNPGDLTRDLQRNVLRTCGQFTLDVADGSPAGECGFVGNGAQAAYTLACPASPGYDVCTDAPSRPGGVDRYLSLEQSMALRLDYACLTQALDDSLP